MFTNSLDDIRIASPCSSDWNSMYGDDRSRFCSDCKLNVYNLSGMTRDEAEQLVMNSEGRLCVRFFRRKDGTILTQDCPVGWRAVKRRVSRIAVAVSSIMAGFLTGVFSLRAFDSAISLIPTGDVDDPAVEETWDVPALDERGRLVEWEGQIAVEDFDRPIAGRVVNVGRIEDVKVKAWVK